MKAFSKLSRHLSIMHIESKLTRSAARRLDLAAGRVRLGKLAGESQGSNIATMRKIDAIGSFE